MARELWFESPRIVALRDGEAPEAPSRGIVARALASGISQGTELLLFRGEGPTPFDPSLDAPGAPTYPRRYGYAWVGEVIACEGSCHRLGDRVFALAPHGELHALHDDAARTIPASIPSARAVLAANLETAITCVWDAQLALGDDVVVLGGGIVGLLIGMLAARAGANVRLIEPSSRRQEAARALGIDAHSPHRVTPSHDADVVIEATGHPAALDAAIAHAAFEARIVVASFYGARVAPIALGDAFHRRRLRLVASQVSSIPASHAARWTYARRFDLVRTLLEDARLDALLEHAAFADAAAVYARLDAEPTSSLQTTFIYES